ncbi:transmembrane protein [Besnoitia besnoiti]|uniref:Transmembrane protein n=1 Tax=Besnoitia besnoiti TaxID=94643 RepID=A0A2A9MFE1_BESBE|nr:uncharacterized protein BESB_074890 [Besnoitia besnoiti]PFH34337.1 transmembrane protein [Besnoitia besnoiti]
MTPHCSSPVGGGSSVERRRRRPRRGHRSRPDLHPHLGGTESHGDGVGSSPLRGATSQPPDEANVFLVSDARATPGDENGKQRAVAVDVTGTGDAEDLQEERRRETVAHPHHAYPSSELAALSAAVWSATRGSPPASRDAREVTSTLGETSLTADVFSSSALSSPPPSDSAVFVSSSSLSSPTPRTPPSLLPSSLPPAAPPSGAVRAPPPAPVSLLPVLSASSCAAEPRAELGEDSALPPQVCVRVEADNRQDNPSTDSSDGSYILLHDGEQKRSLMTAGALAASPHLRHRSAHSGLQGFAAEEPSTRAPPQLAFQEEASAVPPPRPSCFFASLLSAASPHRRHWRARHRDELPAGFEASGRSEGAHGAQAGDVERGGRGGRFDGLPFVAASGGRRRRSSWRRELRALCAVVMAFLKACWVCLKILWERSARWIARNDALVRIVGYTLLLLITSTGNIICFKKMIDKMPNYSPFITQVTTVVFVPVFFSLTVYTDFSGGISQEMKDFPKRNFAIMGFLDSFSGVMAIIGAVHTTGTTQVVLQQSCIVFSLFASISMLRKRFHLAHYLGACVIILGVLFVKLPELLHPLPDGGNDLFFFNLLYLLSNMPAAVSCVFKEVAFRGVEMDVNFLQAWVALFQFVIGFLVLPLSALPMLGPQRVPLTELPASLWNGLRCLFGYDTIVTNCGAGGQPPCDSCAGAGSFVGMYLAFNILYNMFITLVVKNGGAALTFLVSTLRLPVTAIAFCSHAIMGDSAVPAKARDFYGLLILILGLAIYRAGSVMKKRARHRAALAARGLAVPGFDSRRASAREEQDVGSVFVEAVFAAGEVDACDGEEDSESDEDGSEVEVHPVFTSVITPEPPQVRVHAPHHAHGDSGYHKLLPGAPPPAVFTPCSRPAAAFSGDTSWRCQDRRGVASRERSGSPGAFPVDEETGFANGAGVLGSPDASSSLLYDARSSSVGYMPPSLPPVAHSPAQSRGCSNGKKR